MTYPAKISPQVLRTIHGILTQNVPHIHVSFFFNNQEIPSDYVTTLNSKADHLEYTNACMLLSGWNAGNYQYRIVASFDEKINNGISDYAAENIMFAENSQVIRSDVTKKCNKC